MICTLKYRVVNQPTPGLDPVKSVDLSMDTDYFFRRSCHQGTRVDTLSGSVPAFWRAYSRCLAESSLAPLDTANVISVLSNTGVPPRASSREVKACLFYTGGVESLASRLILEQSGVAVDLLHVDPQSVPEDEVRIEGLFAIMASRLGYKKVFIGIENAPSVSVRHARPVNKHTIEYTEEYWRAWSLYSGTELTSVVSSMNRLDLTHYLHRRGALDRVISCDTASFKDPHAKCGDCFKCVVNWVTISEVLELDTDLPEPSQAALDRVRAERRAYRETGKDDFLNMGYFDYLEQVWGVTI